MSLKYSRKEIKAEAKSLGFFACGIVQAMPVDAETATAGLCPQVTHPNMFVPQTPAPGEKQRQ